MSIVFISDFPTVETDILLQNVEDFKIGGAEQDDSAMLFYLSKELDEPIIRKLSSNLTLEDINTVDRYILSNFTGIHPEVLNKMALSARYIIYEHDHKYCSTRNPALFPKFKIPLENIVNALLYVKADAVFCMTEKHKEILTSNIYCNAECINGTFFFPSELELMGKLSDLPKNNKTAIYGHPHPWKGMKESIDFCKTQSLDYEVLSAQPTRRKFLENLATYKSLAFFPNQPETCCRFVVEAKMMNVDTKVSSIVGATGESWYPLNGSALSQFFSTQLFPISIESLLKYL